MIFKNITQLGIAYAIFAISSAWGDTLWHGTWSATYVGRDFVVTSIDSRTTIANPTTAARIDVNDRFCKIVKLDERSFFYAEGLIALHFRDRKLDGGEIARSKYTEMKPDLNRVADSWVSEMLDFFIANYYGAKNSIDNHPGTEVLKGFFVGLRDNGTPFARRATIIQTVRGAPIFKTSVVDVPVDNWAVSDHAEIFSELDRNTSERAKSVNVQIIEETKGRTPPEKEAVRSRIFVKTVMDWGHNPLVGGEIATVVLEKGNPWRWSRRPDFCPEN